MHIKKMSVLTYELVESAIKDLEKADELNKKEQFSFLTRRGGFICFNYYVNYGKKLPRKKKKKLLGSKKERKKYIRFYK